MARVPDERLEKLSALYSPKKTTFATVEYVDVAAIGQEALKETAFLTSLRNNDAARYSIAGAKIRSTPGFSSRPRSRSNVRGYLAKSSVGPNCVGFTKMDTTIASQEASAARTSDKR